MKTNQNNEKTVPTQEQIEAACRQSARHFWNWLTWSLVYYVAVSYTHLDVYKRQILHITCPDSMISYSKGSRGLFVPSRVIGDVYKRQILSLLVSKKSISSNPFIKQCFLYALISKCSLLPVALLLSLIHICLQTWH